MSRRSTHSRWAAMALSLLSATTVASAVEAQESSWRLRLYGFYMETGDTPVIVDGAGTVLFSDNGYGAGLGVSAEYRFAPRFGLDLGVIRADHGDFFPDEGVPDVDVETTSTMGVTVLAAGLNYHFRPEGAVDVYLGGHLAAVDYGGFDIRYASGADLPPGVPASASVGVDTDLGLGAVLGLDLSLDEQWIFHAALRYLATSIEGGGSDARFEAVDYDPILVAAGFGYRF